MTDTNLPRENSASEAKQQPAPDAWVKPQVTKLDLETAQLTGPVP